MAELTVGRKLNTYKIKKWIIKHSDSKFWRQNKAISEGKTIYTSILLSTNLLKYFR